MKRFSVLLLTLGLALALTACGGSASDDAAGNGAAGNGAEVAATAGVSGEITVSCYEAMTQKAFLEEAARLFEEKYPGTKVNVETFSAMPEIRSADTEGGKMSQIQMTEDPQARTDYVTKVSTSLMSGTGADILAADVLPLYKFADSGQLVDLNALMAADADFDRSAYRANILNALTYKEGLWYMPLDYSFEYYAYDSSLINRKMADFGESSAFTTQQLVEIANSFYDGSTKMFNITGYSRVGGGSSLGITSGLFARLLKEQYSTLVDIENREAHFTDGGFAQLLETVKEYEQLGYVNEGVSTQMDPERMMTGRDGPPQPTERFYFKPKNNFSLQQHFNRNSGRRMNVMIMDAGSSLGIEDDDEIAGAQADAMGRVPFTFQYGYAINSASKNQQTAWAFIKFLLSEEMQLSTGINSLGLPLHNAAREQKAELSLSGAFMSTGMSRPGGQDQGQQNPPPEPEPLDEAQRQVLAQYLAATEQLSDLINAYAIHDIVIDDMISAESQYFFDGVKSAEEVATTLQSKVELYLNE